MGFRPQPLLRDAQPAQLLRHARGAETLWGVAPSSQAEQDVDLTDAGSAAGGWPLPCVSRAGRAYAARGSSVSSGSSSSAPSQPKSSRMA